MNKIIFLIIFISKIINLFAQPVNKHEMINKSAYSKAFLHCVTDEKYFAQYAIEAHSGSFDLMEPIKCKLHIPYGINKVWQDAKNNDVNKKGEYDYSKDFWVGIRFNFYLGGELISTAFEDFEKPQKDTGSFSFYFNLDPLDFTKNEVNLNEAYIELLKNCKKNGSQIVIEAALPSKNLNHKSFVPIASTSFYLLYNDGKYEKWTELWAKANTSEKAVDIETPMTLDYNIQLKHLADSTIKSIFGEIGFSKNFAMSCLQNPCEKGCLYANVLVSNKPCTSVPQDKCKEAIVTYSFVKDDVPLTLKLLITMKENGVYVYVENNQFGKKEIAIEKQNILSIAEIQKIIINQFPKDSLAVIANSRALVYSHTRIQQPTRKVEENKLNRDQGYSLIKETKAGEHWENGFVYIVHSRDPKKLKRVYHFDAVTGELLWITEIHNVTN